LPRKYKNGKYEREKVTWKTEWELTHISLEFSEENEREATFKEKMAEIFYNC
jgi:hypothetical protein